MNQTEIRRMTLEKIKEEPCVDLESMAAQILGYKRPKINELARERGELAGVLAELEIEILDRRDVVRYQMERKHEAEKAAIELEIASGSMSQWRNPPSWNQTLISQYKGSVPAYVINKAVQIKQHLPEVEFQVEALTRSLDPFLIARLKKGSYEYESYYVEVWDEPNFKGA